MGPRTQCTWDEKKPEGSSTQPATRLNMPVASSRQRLLRGRRGSARQMAANTNHHTPNEGKMKLPLRLGLRRRRKDKKRKRCRFQSEFPREIVSQQNLHRASRRGDHQRGWCLPPRRQKIEICELEEWNDRAKKGAQPGSVSFCAWLTRHLAEMRGKEERKAIGIRSFPFFLALWQE